VEGSGRGLTKGAIPSFARGTEESYEKPQSGYPASEPNLNPGPTEYGAGVLTTRPTRPFILHVVIQDLISGFI
jgi:hypothetical protein